MKFIATDSNKVNNIPLEKGQLIFSRDNSTIYLDSDVRTTFTTFIILETEEERKNLISPVNGFYFVEETKILWRLSNKEWSQLNEKPEQSIVFADNSKPTTGKENVLYVDNGKIYQWIASENRYIVISDLLWEAIS